MTQENKQQLLKDICARLPYGVYGQFDVPSEKSKFERVLVVGDMCGIFSGVCLFKPYLRPMSSMTEEECITLSKLIPYETDAWKHIKTPIPLYIANIEQFDFFHRHHLDWRGLIQKGLALEAPEGMYEIG